MKHLLLSLTLMLVVGATGIAWHASRDTANAAAALSRLEAEIGRAKVNAQRTESRLAQLDALQRSLPGKLETLARRATPDQAAKAAAANTLRTPETLESIAARIAEARERTKAAKNELADFANERLWFATAYQPLFSALGLSPEQCERFLAIGMRRYERMNDLDALKGEKVIANDDLAAKQFADDTKAQETAAYRELLGPEGYQRFVDYNQTAYARDIVSGLAAAAVLAGIPFTSEQLEQFVRITADGYKNPPWQGQVHFYWNGVSIDWEKVDTQLRPLMSDAQWQLYLTHAPGDTRQQSRMKNIFDALVNKAVAADRAMAATQARK